MQNILLSTLQGSRFRYACYLILALVSLYQISASYHLFQTSTSTNTFYIQPSVINSPIYEMPEAPPDKDSLSTARASILNSTGLLINNYKLTSIVFDDINYSCSWERAKKNAQSSVPLLGQALANPLLLFAPIFLSSNGDNSIQSPKIPKLSSIIYDGHNSRVVASYDLFSTQYQDAANNYPQFILTSINVFDLGYKSARISLTNSNGLNLSPNPQIVSTLSVLDCSDAKEPENTNENRLIITNPLDPMAINSGPAQLSIELWKLSAVELNIKSDYAPELTFIIKFT